MEADDIIEDMTTYLEEMTRMAEEHLLENGNTSEDCQLVLIRQRIHALQSAINGITDEDVKAL